MPDPRVVEAAQQHSAETGIPASVYLALISHENDPNVPLENAATKYNMFGILDSGYRGSLDSQFAAFDQLMFNSRYGGATQQLLQNGNIGQFFNGIANAGYAAPSDNRPVWAANLTNLAGQMGGGAPPSQASYAPPQATARMSSSGGQGYGSDQERYDFLSRQQAAGGRLGPDALSFLANYGGGSAGAGAGGRSIADIGRSGYQNDAERAQFLSNLVSHGTPIAPDASAWLTQYNQNNQSYGSGILDYIPPIEPTAAEAPPVAQGGAPLEPAVNLNPYGFMPSSGVYGNQTTANNMSAQDAYQNVLAYQQAASNPSFNQAPTFTGVIGGSPQFSGTSYTGVGYNEGGDGSGLGGQGGSGSQDMYGGEAPSSYRGGGKFKVGGKAKMRPTWPVGIPFISDRYESQTPPMTDLPPATQGPQFRDLGVAGPNMYTGMPGERPIWYADGGTMQVGTGATPPNPYAGGGDMDTGTQVVGPPAVYSIGQYYGQQASQAPSGYDLDRDGVISILDMVRAVAGQQPLQPGFRDANPGGSMGGQDTLNNQGYSPGFRDANPGTGLPRMDAPSPQQPQQTIPEEAMVIGRYSGTPYAVIGDNPYGPERVTVTPPRRARIRTGFYRR